MHSYSVNVTRDERWWMITVPELGGYVGADGAINLSSTTQARRLCEVAAQARDFVCTVTGKASSEVGVDITFSVDEIDATRSSRPAQPHEQRLCRNARQVRCHGRQRLDTDQD